MNDCLKRFWGWGLILLLGASLIPVGPAGAKEKVLIVGDYSLVNNLDPTSSVIFQYMLFSRNLFQSLLRYKDLRAIPLFIMHYPTPYRPQYLTGLPDKDPVWGFDFYPIQVTEKK